MRAAAAPAGSPRKAPANAADTASAAGASGAADTGSATGTARAAVEILTRSGDDGRWCGGFWPREPGWHRVQAGDVETPLFVRAAGTAVALHRAETLAAMRALPPAAAAAGQTQRPGPRWPWFLAWLMPASLLWWLQRRARRAGTGT